MKLCYFLVRLIKKHVAKKWLQLIVKQQHKMLYKNK